MKQIEVCHQCGRIGHRADVCVNPAASRIRTKNMTAKCNASCEDRTIPQLINTAKKDIKCPTSLRNADGKKHDGKKRNTRITHRSCTPAGGQLTEATTAAGAHNEEIIHHPTCTEEARRHQATEPDLAQDTDLDRHSAPTAEPPPHSREGYWTRRQPDPHHHKLR
ncbi:hypothetical protein HPB50_000795 [Hyalomma asiaticum]|uniref:Uncharacterized protein n=1 Tax=Hyalomma asiaticum TaxID=266040 RepID=A0ACB7T116_HYAAI|nr:hypothetical protein HPB50_000795 [Hyalomma asiaticum]